MALIVPGVGEVIALGCLVNKQTPQDLVLRLYTNNHTPAYADTAGSYTEASGNGYAAITLTGANWSVSGSDPATASYAQQVFTFTGALGNVYGYYLTQTTSGTLVYAELFSDGPYNIVNNGGQIKITPTITAT